MFEINCDRENEIYDDMAILQIQTKSKSIFTKCTFCYKWKENKLTISSYVFLFRWSPNRLPKSNNP